MLPFAGTIRAQRTMVAKTRRLTAPPPRKAVFYTRKSSVGLSWGHFEGTKMFLRLITPAPVRSRSGNRITAERWAGLLKDLGHRVEIAQEYDGGPCDVLIALRALKSFEAIRRFHLARPGAPLVVALGGTDLYHDIHRNRNARL